MKNKIHVTSQKYVGIALYCQFITCATALFQFAFTKDGAKFQRNEIISNSFATSWHIYVQYKYLKKNR